MPTPDPGRTSDSGPQTALARATPLAEDKVVASSGNCAWNCLRTPVFHLQKKLQENTTVSLGPGESFV